nr:cathepsin G=plasma-membrane associated protease [human, monocytic cell line U937, Peptide Partial, 10 aa] [Homo sapiens]
IIGGRESRPH